MVNTQQLSCFAIFSLVVGSMMGAGIFDIPQNLTHHAGTIAIIISWLITGFGMIAMVLSMLNINNLKPEIESGIYGYAKAGFGDNMAFNTAWGYWLSANIGTISYFIYIFSSLSNFKLFHFFGHGNNLYSLISSSILLWLIYYLIARGIKEASLINIIITILKIASLVIILVIFLYFFKIKQFSNNYHHDWEQIKTASSFLQQLRSTMMVTVWDFLGIECALIMSSRAKSKKDVRTATLSALTLVIVIISCLSLLALGILPTADIAKLNTPSTTGVLEHCLPIIVGVISASDFIRIAIIVCVLGALLAWILSASNILYEAAKDGSMPAFIKKTNHKQVPINALLITVVFLQLSLFVSFFTELIYLILIQLSASALLFPYLTTVIYSYRLVTKQQPYYRINYTINIIALLYILWLIYAGGLFYFIINTGLYLAGNFLYHYYHKK